jgi:hypothetical protein
MTMMIEIWWEGMEVKPSSTHAPKNVKHAGSARLVIICETRNVFGRLFAVIKETGRFCECFCTQKSWTYLAAMRTLFLGSKQF